MDSKYFVLALVVISLFTFHCASQRSSQEGMTEEDENFRQELLAMLEDAEKTPDSTESREDTDEGILSILSEDVEQKESSAATDETQEETDDWWSETDDIWEETESESSSVQTDDQETDQYETDYSSDWQSEDNDDLPASINRMEQSMDTKSKKLDSLRQVLEARGERLDQLENRIKSAKSGGKTGQSGGSSSGFMRSYQQARSQFENENYRGCIQSMQSILQRYPSARMADNCQYWIAESYFGLGQYDKAVIEFQKVFAYESTDKHDDAQLMIALSYKRMGQTEQAKQAFRTFLETYPDSEYVGLARKYMSM